MVIPDKYCGSKERSFICMHEFFHFCPCKYDAEIVVDLLHTSLFTARRRRKKKYFWMLMPHHYFRVRRARPRHHLVITQTGGIPEGKTRGVICQPFDNWRRRRSRHYFPHLAVPRFAPFGYFSCTSWGILGQHASCILRTVTLRKKYKNTQPLTSDPIRLNLF